MVWQLLQVKPKSLPMDGHDDLESDEGESEHVSHEAQVREFPPFANK